MYRKGVKTNKILVRGTVNTYSPFVLPEQGLRLNNKVWVRAPVKVPLGRRSSRLLGIEDLAHCALCRYIPLVSIPVERRTVQEEKVQRRRMP